MAQEAVGSVQGHRLVELDPGESVCLRPSNLPQQSAAKSWRAREHALPAVGGTGHHCCLDMAFSLCAGHWGPEQALHWEAFPVYEWLPLG